MRPARELLGNFTTPGSPCIVVCCHQSSHTVRCHAGQEPYGLIGRACLRVIFRQATHCRSSPRRFHLTHMLIFEKCDFKCKSHAKKMTLGGIMATAKDKVSISVAIDKDIKLLLEKYSKEVDLTLSKLARNLIYVAIDSYAFKLLSNKKIGRLVVSFRAMLGSIPAYKEKIDKKAALIAEQTTTISVVIDSDLKEQLEQIGNQIGLPLKLFARNLIYIALDDFKLLRNIGLIRLAVAFRDFMEKFQSYDFQDDERYMTTK